MLKGQAKKDYQKEYMERKRSNKGLTKGEVVTKTVEAVMGLTQDGSNTEGLTEYPANMKPLLTSLGDPKQRAKLRAIHDSLDRRNLTSEVRYGTSGPTFNTVGELLEAF